MQSQLLVSKLPPMPGARVRLIIISPPIISLQASLKHLAVCWEQQRSKLDSIHHDACLLCMCAGAALPAVVVVTAGGSAEKDLQDGGRSGATHVTGPGGALAWVGLLGVGVGVGGVLGLGSWVGG